MPRVSLHLADCDAWRPGVFAETLSADEQARAQRFHHAVDRERFVVRRGLLRRLLGERLGIEASRVPLEPGPAGKPMLAAAALRRARVAAAENAPHFNLARSGGLALFAFLTPENARAVTGPAAPDGPALGVDLERIDTDRRSLADLRRIAEHFASEETRFLESLPDARAAEVFYRLWTCKEACLKCLGTGIGGGGPTLADVVIALNPDGTVSGTARTASGRSWRVASLTPCPGSTAAVAVPAAEASTSGESLSLVVDPQPIEPEAAERAVSRVAAPPPGRAPEAP
jgi:4'-phosphopantetheinyl transferase